jgi:hypothetical protein
MYVPGLGDMGTTWRLRRSKGCAKTALPRVRMECALVTEMIETGRVATVRPVLLATACARASSSTGSTYVLHGGGATGSSLCGVHCGSSVRRCGPWQPRPRARWCRGRSSYRLMHRHIAMHSMWCRSSRDSRRGTCTHKTSSRVWSGEIILIN